MFTFVAIHLSLPLNAVGLFTSQRRSIGHPLRHSHDNDSRLQPYADNAHAARTFRSKVAYLVLALYDVTCRPLCRFVASALPIQGSDK